MANIILEGATATVIGMGIVFGVLAILAGVLSFFKYLNPPATKAVDLDEDFDDDGEELEVVEEIEEIVLEDTAAPIDDSELIAVISAAISAFIGTNEQPVIRQIEAVGNDAYSAVVMSKLKNPSSAWKIAAKRENQRGLY